jgi:hypothetical protein
VAPYVPPGLVEGWLDCLTRPGSNGATTPYEYN